MAIAFPVHMLTQFFVVVFLLLFFFGGFFFLGGGGGAERESGAERFSLYFSEKNTHC